MRMPRIDREIQPDDGQRRAVIDRQHEADQELAMDEARQGRVDEPHLGPDGRGMAPRQPAVDRGDDRSQSRSRKKATTGVTNTSDNRFASARPLVSRRSANCAAQPITDADRPPAMSLSLATSSGESRCCAVSSSAWISVAREVDARGARRASSAACSSTTGRISTRTSASASEEHQQRAAGGEPARQRATIRAGRPRDRADRRWRSRRRTAAGCRDMSHSSAATSASAAHPEEPGAAHRPYPALSPAGPRIQRTR